jgi:hypothetical protein
MYSIERGLIKYCDWKLDMAEKILVVGKIREKSFRKKTTLQQIEDLRLLYMLNCHLGNHTRNQTSTEHHVQSTNEYTHTLYTYRAGRRYYSLPGIFPPPPLPNYVMPS